MAHAPTMHKEEGKENSLFGFWLYIMSDCLLFASLFATFAVLRTATAGGPAGIELFNLNFVLGETMILLTSSFAAGLSLVAAQHKKKKYVLLALFVTLILGLSFIGMEIFEFHNLITEGASFTGSAFLSSFFALVGTHGLHVIFGMIFMLVLIAHIFEYDLDDGVMRKLMCFTLFWHFLDVVWIFIFTFVYLY